MPVYSLWSKFNASVSISNKVLLRQQEGSNTRTGVCWISRRLSRGQSAAALAHLGHHSRSGVDLRGVWVGHHQVHYARPGLCPHVACKRTDDSAGESVMRRLLRCSAAIEPDWFWRCESHPSGVEPPRPILHSTLQRANKSPPDPNAATARDTISAGCTSTLRRLHFEALYHLSYN